jgi:serine/threonine protein kinase
MPETPSTPPKGSDPPGIPLPPTEETLPEKPSSHSAEPLSAPPPTHHPQTPRAQGDDAPTVISRNPRRARAVEELLGSSVRGCRLVHYELIEPLGIGGMAAVLRAHDTQLDRDVALKILPPEMAEEPENILRFHQEARSAAKLDHENIARVFFYGEDRGLHFIAFEFVEGEDLRTLIERNGRLPVRELLPYIIQVTAGLVHAFERNVVHRDIKPSNILITPEGKAKLVDMGLARILDPEEDMRALTHSGVTLGTFDYISPEQALEPRAADVRSDIYSLGCTFYHALTGHPPVPEGTAAKKVHCHQNVPPLDPRQFVPDLPTQVAVILDRMMAKDPAERYQNPTDLLHDLAAVARDLGIPLAPDLGLPEDFHPRHTAILEPPSPRSGHLLAVALAVTAVLALIILLGQSPREGGAPPGTSGNSGGAGRVAVAPGERRPQPPGPEVPGPPQPPDEGPPEKSGGMGPDAGHVKWTPPSHATVDDLAEWVVRHRGARVIEIVLEGELDLSPRGKRSEQGLRIEADEVIIQAKDSESRPTLYFAYDGNFQEGGPRAALTIRSRVSHIEGIRLVLDQRMAEQPAMAGILYRGGGKHRIDNCEFLQTRRPRDPARGRLASVFVQGDGARPAVSLSGCCFAGYREAPKDLMAGMTTPLAFRGIEHGGQDAVRILGPAQITAQQCAFAPHEAAFRVEGPADDVSLQVLHCSVLMAHAGAAFDWGAGAGGRLEVVRSLFSHPRWPSPREGTDTGGVLLRQADRSGSVFFQGEHNVYHALASFRERADSSEGQRTWKKFAEWLDAGANGKDESVAVTDAPWDESSQELAARLESLRFLRAFSVQPERADLRDPENPSDHLIGAETLLGAALFPDGLGPVVRATSAVTSPRELIVDPKVDDSNKNFYPKLESAISVARPGDTITLRVNGELEIRPVPLNTRDLSDLTIRAYEGFHPVLVLGDSTARNTSLFEVHNGTLLFEGVEFRVRCDRGFDSLTLVALAGDGTCSFNRCIVTLDRNGMGSALSVAQLSPAGEVMASDPPAAPRTEGPRLTFTETVIRGHGELLRSLSTRPFSLEATDSFVALGGSLLSVEVPESDVAPADGQKGVLRLKKVTAYLGGHLVRIDASKNPRGLIPIHAEPDRCLFAPAPTGRALLHLEGIEPDREMLKDRLLVWEGGENVYGPFTSLLDMPLRDDVGMGLVMSKEKWRTFTGEAASHFAVKLASSPRGVPFPEVDPASVKLPEEIGDFGADLSRLPAVPISADEPALPPEMLMMPE